MSVLVWNFMKILSHIIIHGLWIYFWTYIMVQFTSYTPMVAWWCTYAPCDRWWQLTFWYKRLFQKVETIIYFHTWDKFPQKEKQKQKGKTWRLTFRFMETFSCFTLFLNLHVTRCMLHVFVSLYHRPTKFTCDSLYPICLSLFSLDDSWARHVHRNVDPVTCRGELRFGLVHTNRNKKLHCLLLSSQHPLHSRSHIA